jgi:hypothetical protein
METLSLDLITYTKATKEAIAANARLAGAVPAVPSRWLIAVAGDIEHVDTTGQIGAAHWPASDRVLSFSAAGAVQLGMAAISPEGTSGFEQLRHRVTNIGWAGTYTVEGSDEFATIDEVSRALEYLRQSEALAAAPTYRSYVATYHATPSNRLRQRFNELVTQWRSETALESSVNRRAMNWAYQQIIGLGPDALPLILEELERETDDWFWALAAIAGEDPAEGTETLAEAAEAWLAWGSHEGHLSDRVT